MLKPAGPILYPLTIAQRDIWVAQVLDPTSDFLTACSFDFFGTVDIDLLEQALRQAVGENDSQRLNFVSTEDGARQYFRPITDFKVLILDFSCEDDPSASAIAWMRTDRAKAFDVANDLLFRYALIKTAADRLILYGANHHLTNDWFGSSLLFRRIVEIYSAFVERKDPPPRYLLSFLELLEEDAAYQRSGRHTRDKKYWSEQLASRPDALTLSGQPPNWPGAVRTSEATIPADTVERLKRLGNAHGASLSAVIMAAAAIYQARMTGASDIILGMPVAARTSPRMRRVVGMAMNILPLRLSVDLSEPIGPLLLQVGRRVRDALRHQRYCASELRHDLGLTPDQPSLYGTLVNFKPVDEDFDFAGCRDPEARSF